MAVHLHLIRLDQDSIVAGDEKVERSFKDAQSRNHH